MSPDRFDLLAAPCHVSRIQLRCRDLDGMDRFYRRVIGLELLVEEPGRKGLGVDGQVLVELAGDPTLAPRDARQAGLFHTAFLLPSRLDLAHWLVYAAENRVPLQGASDHIVSEAIYLADPEGNGIEIYVDRPPSVWQDARGEIRMSTDPLDLDSLVGEIQDSRWQGFPSGGLIGHVHLQVGDTAAAERFYGDVLGFDVMARYPGATFLAVGGYHHQLAGNVWNSRGAGKRSVGMAGLGWVEFTGADDERIAGIIERASRAGDTVTDEDGAILIADPWGTQVIFRRR